MTPELVTSSSSSYSVRWVDGDDGDDGDDCDNDDGDDGDGDSTVSWGIGGGDVTFTTIELGENFANPISMY